MSLQEIFADEEKKTAYYGARRSDLRAAFNAAVRKKSISLRTAAPYVRLFFDSSLLEGRFHNFLTYLDHALQGGVFMGHAKFGEYDVMGAGWAKTSKNERLPHIDVFPSERVEFQNGPLKTSVEICDEVLTDRRLLTQFESWGIVEAQTSSGLAVIPAVERPVLKLG